MVARGIVAACAGLCLKRSVCRHLFLMSYYDFYRPSIFYGSLGHMVRTKGTSSVFAGSNQSASRSTSKLGKKLSFRRGTW